MTEYLTESAAGNWQWFNNLITNVELSQDQLTAMFSNLPTPEVKAWIKEVQDCYVGAPEEDEAKAIRDYKGLAQFYANHPVVE